MTHRGLSNSRRERTIIAAVTTVLPSPIRTAHWPTCAAARRDHVKNDRPKSPAAPCGAHWSTWGASDQGRRQCGSRGPSRAPTPDTSGASAARLVRQHTRLHTGFHSSKRISTATKLSSAFRVFKAWSPSLFTCTARKHQSVQSVNKASHEKHTHHQIVRPLQVPLDRDIHLCLRQEAIYVVVEMHE